MIIFGILIFMFVIIAAAANANRQVRLPPPEPIDDRSPNELAADDPVEALRRYGTPADAERLGEQGVDLGGLGYRPPDA